MLSDVTHSILRIVIVATLISCSLVRPVSNADVGNRLVGNEVVASMQTADSYGNITFHYGALTVANNSKLVIENCMFNQTGSVTIEDEAEVIIRNALYFSVWNSSGYSPHEHFVLRDHAKLTILNSTLKFTSAPTLYVGVFYDEIVCYNQSVVNITESTIPYFNPYAGIIPPDNVNYWGNYVFGYDNSTILLDSVVLSIFQRTGDSDIKSGVHLENQSHAKIWNSTVEYLEINYYWTNTIVNSRCNVEIADSNLSSLEAYYDASELQISNSSISEAVTFGPDTEIHFTNTTVDWIWGNRAKLWLYNSTIQRLDLPHDTIWVVWDLPLLGQVSIPYDWAPLLVPVVVTAVVLTVILALTAVLILRLRRKEKAKTTAGKKSISTFEIADLFYETI